MRARRFLWGLGSIVLAVVALVAGRPRDSEPKPDGVVASDPAPKAPPQLPPPGLAPAPRPTPGALPAKPGEPVPEAEAQKQRTARVEGTVVTAEANVPIRLLKLHLAFRKEYGATPLTLHVETGHDGSFSGELPTAEPIPLSDGWVDGPGLQFRGFRRAADDGTDPESDVVARPGETLRLIVTVARLATWKGLVVDDDGHPLAGMRVSVFLPGPNDSPFGSGFMTETSLEGRFTVSALAEPDRVLPPGTALAAAQLTVSDLSGAMRPTLKLDLRTVPEPDREELRIVLSRGRRVRGRLVDDAGRALAGTQVLATYGDPTRLRAAMTEPDGKFALEALADGAVTIGCFLADRELEARIDTTLSGDVDELLLVARPIDPGDAKRGLVVLGARLVNVTDEMRVARGLDASVRVLVLDRGSGGAFGDRADVGAGILQIGHSKVVDVAHLVDLLIAEQEIAAKERPRFPMIRIVTTWGEGKHRGTNTQHFGLGPGAEEHLRRVQQRLRTAR